MFTLNENYEVNGNILKCDCIRFSPYKISTKNTCSSQKYITIPREGSVFSLLNVNLDLNFDVLHAATGNRFANIIDRRLVNLSPIGLLSNYMLTTSSGKRLKEISHAHIVSMIY